MIEYDSIFILKIFNLNFKTSEEKLRTEFAKFGTIACCKLFQNRDGLSKGIGFVKYLSNKDAQSALAAMTNQEIDNRSISIDLQTEMVPKTDKNEPTTQSNANDSREGSPQRYSSNGSHSSHDNYDRFKHKNGYPYGKNGYSSNHPQWRKNNYISHDRDRDRNHYREYAPRDNDSRNQNQWRYN